MFSQKRLNESRKQIHRVTWNVIESLTSSEFRELQENAFKYSCRFLFIQSFLRKQRTKNKRNRQGKLFRKVTSIKKHTKLVTSLILCLARHTKEGPLKSWGISVYRGTGHWRFCLTIAMWDRDTTTLTGSKLRSVKNQETIITTSFYF